MDADNATASRARGSGRAMEARRTGAPDDPSVIYARAGAARAVAVYNSSRSQGESSGDVARATPSSTSQAVALVPGQAALARATEAAAAALRTVTTQTTLAFGAGVARGSVGATTAVG